MASKVDITNWKKELPELMKGDFCTNGFWEVYQNHPSIPASKIFEFMDHLLTDPKLLKNLQIENDWENANPDLMPFEATEENPFPWDHVKEIDDFAIWFQLKYEMGPNHSVFGRARGVCLEVAAGRLPSTQCAEAIEHLDPNRRYLDWQR